MKTNKNSVSLKGINLQPTTPESEAYPTAQVCYSAGLFNTIVFIVIYCLLDNTGLASRVWY